ncbi:aspartate aminotransferase family protein [Niveispirillum sp.]|uniref:aspartate aminotransferase family protein n=1 Tax=Niveispirillum sp. TaxID=1917217 RepID=UPI001B555F0B|nr:aspartate aminotransferase family protein [Niveispirillum sp.]MBP7334330.1 aspartate aminotransferase family protein [Niveispirillum sp.]
MSDIDALILRRQRVLGRNSPLFYDRPLHLVRGEGAWVYDADGRAYLDVYNNVPCVGHCHPHVVDAIARQTATLNLHTRYLDETLVAYAERLTSLFADPLDTVMLTCSGTEANELALRLARFVTGGQGIIVSDLSYHGNSTILAGMASSFPGGEPFPSFARAVRVPDPAHDRQGRTDAELAAAFAAQVQAAVDSLKAEGIQVAALLLDSFFANEGLPDPVPCYVEQAVEIVRRAGGLFICDEVQSGFARTGDAMWGHQLTGVTPDIVTLGKPMGNGYPVAGMVTRRDWVDRFGAASRYFNTFAGNPVAAAAGMAVLSVIEQEDIQGNSRRVGAHVRAGLGALAARHKIIAGVRGRGLFFGVELIRPDGTPADVETKRLINRMRDNGVLISRIGRNSNILKMRPPLVFSTDNADHLLSVMDDALAAL